MQDDYQLDLEDYKNQNNFNQKPPIGKNQKIAVAVLAVFALFIVGMWAVQLKKSITDPFAYKGESANNQNDAPYQQEDGEESLKSKDTDGDGLSDWDELYFYKTSPYLEDSDSDGFSDKQEINNSKDPNCPTGRDCADSGIVDGDTGVANNAGQAGNNQDLTNNLLNQFNASASSSAPSTSGAAPSAADIQGLLGGSMDAATLRQLLLEHGMQKEMLDQISDQDLMSSFNDMTQSGQ